MTESTINIPVGIVTTALVVAGTILVGTLTAWLARRSHRDDNLRKDVASLRTEVAGVKRENRILADYVHQLRTLLDEAGEDVPPWPDGLTT